MPIGAQLQAEDAEGQRYAVGVTERQRDNKMETGREKEEEERERWASRKRVFLRAPAADRRSPLGRHPAPLGQSRPPDFRLSRPWTPILRD